MNELTKKILDEELEYSEVDPRNLLSEKGYVMFRASSALPGSEKDRPEEDIERARQYLLGKRALRLILEAKKKSIAKSSIQEIAKYAVDFETLVEDFYREEK